LAGRRDLFVNVADTANESDECCQLIRGVHSFVFIEQRIGAPDTQRRELRSIGLEGV
jgi:hypothetical protein